MSTIDNTGVYYRGEVITLWTAFTSMGELVDQPSGFPTVEVQAVNPSTSELTTLLSASVMTEAEDGRYYYQWVIPTSAPLSDAQIVFRGEIAATDVVNTTVIQIREKKVKNVAGVAIDPQSVSLSCPTTVQKKKTCPPGTPSTSKCS